MSTPVEWLPQHAIPVTVVVTHPDYDDSVLLLRVARDYISRGEDYIRSIANLDTKSAIVAVFGGHHQSTLGSGVNE